MKIYNMHVYNRNKYLGHILRRRRFTFLVDFMRFYLKREDKLIIVRHVTDHVKSTISKANSSFRLLI